MRGRYQAPKTGKIKIGQVKAGQIKTGVGRVLAVLCSVVLFLVIGLYCVMLVLTHGPSENAKRIFVLSANETSAMKFLPSLCMSKTEIEEILSGVGQTEIEAPPVDPALTELGYAPGVEPPVFVPETEKPPETQPEIEIVDLKGATYKGKLMIVKDPSRVIVGTLDHYGTGYGLYMTEFIEKYGAIGGTNAGGFEDINGNGTGAIPDGLVIKDGKLAWGAPGAFYNDVIGFDAEHKLHVGNMTGQEALNLGIVSAVSFAPGPVLIKDGVVQANLGGGMNPRTCIGQRPDGTVLLAVIEGRHPSSFGATYDDLAKLMSDYGAVNAANLDGGSSSTMFYEGEQITRGSNIVGSRQMATAILVLPKEEGGAS